MRKDELARLIDEFGKTSDATFPLEELLGYLDDRAGRRVDDQEVMKLAGSSPYLFESWNDPMTTRYIPRRRFFQGAEFIVTPTADEVAGGWLFPGQRLMPFVNPEVFPADAWLVLEDGSAPKVKRVETSRENALAALRWYGDDRAKEYLVSDDAANEKSAGRVSVSAFDLRDFYLANAFQPGDSVCFRVLDWLQGVCSIRKAGAPVEEARWSAAMTAGFARTWAELGDQGDCCEQLAIMMLLAKEDERYPLMKNPPLSLEAWFSARSNARIKVVGDRAYFEPRKNAAENGSVSLDALLKDLGLSAGAVEAEAYMRDELRRGAKNADGALARVCAGRPLLFKTPEGQEAFHHAWLELWRKVVASGSAEE